MKVVKTPGKRVIKGIKGSDMEAKKIIEVLLRMGYSYARIAEMAGMTRQSISRIHQGDITVHKTTQEKMENVLRAALKAKSEQEDLVRRIFRE